MHVELGPGAADLLWRPRRLLVDRVGDDLAARADY
jgi:hypothetical protein